MAFLAEAGRWGAWAQAGIYKNILETRLRNAFKAFVVWKRQRGLTSTHGRFTPARINRRMRSDFPSHSSKAIASKAITFWLSEECTAHASRPQASDLDRLVATCVWAYAQFLKLMDSFGPVLTVAEAEQMFNAGQLHLQSFAELRALSARAAGRAPNRCLWQLLPKHHFMLHAIYAMRETCQPILSHAAVRRIMGWGHLQNGEAVSSQQCVNARVAALPG